MSKTRGHNFKIGSLKEAWGMVGVQAEKITLSWHHPQQTPWVERSRLGVHYSIFILSG